MLCIMHACTCVYMYTHVYLHVYTCIPMHAHVYLHAYTCIPMHAHVYLHASTCVCTCLPVYTYRLDTETEGSTALRDPKALGCSDRAQRGRY